MNEGAKIFSLGPAVVGLVHRCAYMIINIVFWHFLTDNNSNYCVCFKTNFESVFKADDSKHININNMFLKISVLDLQDYFQEPAKNDI